MEYVAATIERMVEESKGGGPSRLYMVSTYGIGKERILAEVIRLHLSNPPPPLSPHRCLVLHSNAGLPDQPRLDVPLYWGRRPGMKDHLECLDPLPLTGQMQSSLRLFAISGHAAKSSNCNLAESLFPSGHTHLLPTITRACTITVHVGAMWKWPAKTYLPTVAGDIRMHKLDSCSAFADAKGYVQVHRRCGFKVFVSERKLGVMQCLELPGDPMHPCWMFCLSPWLPSASNSDHAG